MKAKDKVFIWCIGVSVITLFVSNLLAFKLTVFHGIAVDCGILSYPVSYVIGDLTIEFFGKKRANYVLFVATLLTIFSAGLFGIAIALPKFPSWVGQNAFATVFGFVPRVIAGSVLGFLLSGLANNLLFEKIRASTNQKNLAARVLGSSALAHFVDSAVFETVAFFGVLRFREFLAQAIFAYVAGFAMECLLFVIATKPIHRFLCGYLQKPLDS